MDIKTKKQKNIKQCVYTKFIQQGFSPYIADCIMEALKVDIKKRFGWRYTGLHFAAMREKGKYACKLLLAKGVKIDARDVYGRTALHEAVLWNHLEVARFLIQNGADVNARGRRGGTPLLNAAGNEGAQHLVKLLIKNGAKVNQEDDFGRTPLSVARQNDTNINAKLLIAAGAKEVFCDWGCRSKTLEYTPEYKEIENALPF